jgi:plastocyanin
MQIQFRLIIVLTLAAAGADAQRGRRADSWISEELPLQLSVKTVEDLRIKALAERQYLIFNLLGQGKLAWDRGDFGEAARRWEELLRLPELDPKVASELRPFAEHARKRSGGQVTGPMVVEPAKPSSTKAPVADKSHAEPKPTVFRVTGTVSGGEGGPGGAVVTLHRVDGKTPKPRATKDRYISQKNKTFSPHVLVVTTGSSVAFTNMDPIFHNVFSLSAPKKFDAGFKKSGEEEWVTFDKAGVVEVLCNIHARMQAYVVVVDTPYHAIANASGTFSIRNVPPGDYNVEVWHESSSALGKDKITVTEEGAPRVALSVGADKRKNPFPVDKYGKPRQTQLGY